LDSCRCIAIRSILETAPRTRAERGRGLGATLNLPVTYGTPRREYLAAYAAAVEQFADKFKPQLVLVSAGFDAHHLDPIGSLERFHFRCGGSRSAENSFGIRVP
jgi:acetoin utilization deacetylase AcuC-like enzyme